MSKILVVEDNHSIRELLIESLEDFGHFVQSASTGDEAVDLGYSFNPDVIVADWDLGCDYDGFEVAAACFHADRNVKTIVISGHTQRLKQVAASEFVFTTLEKPFSLQRFKSTIDLAISEKLPHSDHDSATKDNRLLPNIF
jgi:DNA-binding NtrC family response regulator